MNALIAIVSVLSLLLAATAYSQVEGKDEVKRGEPVKSAYEASRNRLQHAREVLRETAHEAIKSLEQQIKRAQEQVETLAHRLEEEARTASQTRAARARAVEQALAVRIRRIEARTMLLHAKAKATLAMRAAETQDFRQAEQLLDDATELVRSARTTLGEDHAYDELLDEVKQSLRDATTAVRTQAKNVHKRVEEVLADTDRLVASLESDEKKAANQEK